MVDRRWANRGPPNYPFVLNRESLQARGLLGWWPTLASPGANVLQDLIKRKNDGVFPGGIDNPTWSSVARLGFVLEFDDVNTYVNVPASPDINNLSEFSATAWIIVRSGDGYIFDKRVNNNAGWLFWIDGTPTLRGWVYTDGTDALSNSSNVIPLNEAVHIAMTYSDSGARVSSLYLNGIEVVYTSQPTGTGSLGDDSSKDMRLGESAFGLFDGFLGDTRIYNRVLTPIEVYQLYAHQTRWELYQPIRRLWAFAAGLPAQSSVSAYLKGQDLTSSSQPAYLRGVSSANANKSAYLSGIAFGSTFSQEYFRIRSGDTVGLNTDSGWAAAENASATIGTGLPFRIRFKVRETAGGNEDIAFKLQVNRNAAGWVDVVTTGGGSAGVSVLSSQYANADPATELLTNTSTYVNGEGLEADNLTASYSLTLEEAEFEWCLMLHGFFDGPTQNVAGDTLEFRIVESDSTVLNSYTNPTITVSETPGFIGGCYVETPNRLGPFADTNGNLYTIIEPADTDNDFVIIKSADGGDTWREVDGTNRPATNDLESVDAVQATDTIHISHHGDSVVVYNEFRMSDHPTNADTWGTTDSVVASVTGPSNQQSTAIERRSDGDLVVFYNRDVSGQEELYYKINTGVGWGSEQTLETQVNYDWGFVSCVRGASDKIHIFYKGTGSSLGPIYHKSLSSADSLSSREVVDSDTGNSNSHRASLTTPIYWDSSGDEKIMILFSDQDDDILYSVVVTNDGSPETRKTVSDNTVETSAAGSGSKQVIANLTNDGSVSYAHYANLADLDIYRDKATNDGGWGTDVEERDGVTCHWIRGAAFTHSAGNGGSTVVGYIWDNGSLGGTGYIFYNEFVIRTPTLDNQAAYLSGASAGTPASDSSTAYLIGQSTGSDNKAVYIGGESIDSISQSAFMAGEASVLDNASAYLGGQSPAIDSTSVYMSGIATLTSQKSAYTAGEALAQSSAPTYLKGQNISSNTMPVYMAAEDTASGNIAGYMFGDATVIGSALCYIAGELQGTTSKPAFLSGGIAVIGSKTAYLSGSGTAVSSSQPIYIPVGGAAQNRNQAYLSGSDTSGGAKPCYLAGASTLSDSKSLYLAGASTTLDSQGVYLTGWGQASSGAPLYLNGAVQTQEQQALYLRGMLSSLASKSAYINATPEPTSSVSVYMSGYSADAIGEITIFSPPNEIRVFAPPGEIRVFS